MSEGKALLFGYLLLGGASVVGWLRNDMLQTVDAIPKAFQGEWVSISDESRWPRVLISDTDLFFMKVRPRERSSHLIEHQKILADRNQRRVIVGAYLLELQTNRVIKISLVDRSGADHQPVSMGQYTLDARMDFDTGITVRVLEPR